ncbi:MAG TPA: DUF2461 family protein [Blastocatellia bacterium]|nr:DUF2461 family protein [Blastocatellia bacterium]
MGNVRFEGFSPELFDFLRGLSENNNKDWFDQQRRRYETEVLAVTKAFVTELGPFVGMLNQELETEPRVGKTVSRINNDIRFHKDRPLYRPFIYVSFPRRDKKWSDEALLYAGIFPHGVSVGFYPGGHRPLRTGPVQNGVRNNFRLFQRYLTERRIAATYWELVGGEDGSVKKWPLPKTARRWVDLEGFIVGEYFASSEKVLSGRSFLDRAQRIILDLYPLWLFATSDDPASDLALYHENVRLLARPLSKARL